MAADETASKLTVRAVSKADSTISGTAPVTLISLKTSAPAKSAVPADKRVKRGKKITLKAPKNTILYYTTNGKKPTKSSLKVKAGKSKRIKIKKKTVLKVFAVKTGYKASKIVTRTYKIK